MKNKTLIALACAALLSSCGVEQKQVEKTTILKTISVNTEDTLTNNGSRIKEAHSGVYAFRTDSSSQYAAGILENLDDSLLNSSIRLCVNFWVKTNKPMKGDGLAVSYNLKDAIVSWQSFDPINYGIKANEWTNIVDSITFNASQFKEPGMLIKVFGYNANKAAVVDFDDVTITLKKVYTVLE